MDIKKFNATVLFVTWTTVMQLAASKVTTVGSFDYGLNAGYKGYVFVLLVKVRF